MCTYVFDGSIEGLLTAIFEYYERRPATVSLVHESDFQPSAFDEALVIVNDDIKAGRVWKGLMKRLSPQGLQRFYFAYLSEQPECHRHLFDFARYIFNGGAENNYGNPHVLAVAQTDRKVHREKHRMEAFIRFQKTGDGLYFASVQPDFNVLPVIVPHFRNRYADQPWIIYDLKRNYGIHYDLKAVTTVTMDFVCEADITAPGLYDSAEALYSLLWKDYFKSTNIEARKNKKLHLKHVPKRYWKYLTEKQTDFLNIP
jgi:probable DNA metabolism protein